MSFAIESLSNELFTPLAEKEASLVVGVAAAQAIYTGFLANTFLNGVYIGTDAVIVDELVPIDVIAVAEA